MAFSATDAMPLSQRLKLLMGAAGLRRVPDPRARHRPVGGHPRLATSSGCRGIALELASAARYCSSGPRLTRCRREARADDAVDVDHERRAIRVAPLLEERAVGARRPRRAARSRRAAGSRSPAARPRRAASAFESTEIAEQLDVRPPRTGRGCRAARTARPCRCPRTRAGRTPARPASRRGIARAATVSPNWLARAKSGAARRARGSSSSGSPCRAASTAPSLAPGVAGIESLGWRGATRP